MRIKEEALLKMAVEYFNMMSLQLQGVIESMDGQYIQRSISSRGAHKNENIRETSN